MFNQSLLISILLTNNFNEFGILEWEVHIYDYANKAGVGRFHPHINVLIQFEHSLAPEQYSICMKLILKNDSALKITSMY